MNRRPSNRKGNPVSFTQTRYHTTDPERFLSVVHRRKPLRIRIIRFLLCILCLLLCMNTVANHFIHILRVTVPITSLHPDIEGYTILHLSDLKGITFGLNQSRFKSLLQNEEFNAVILSGDMVSDLGNAQPLYDLIETLRLIKPSIPIWFIAGDSDPQATSKQYTASGSSFAPWILGCQHRGAIWLTSPVLLFSGTQDIWLAPASELSLDIGSQQSRFENLYLSAKSSGDKNEIELAEYNLRRLEELRVANQTMAKDSVCIAVTHVLPEQNYLSTLRFPSGQSIDLLLCGHWLGGLVRIPFLGPLFIPSQSLPHFGILPEDDVAGLKRYGSTWVYENAGLGNYDSAYPVFFRRFFNPPSAALITLTTSKLQYD